MILGVKTVWCLATLFWPSINAPWLDAQGLDQYHYVVSSVERVCAFLTFHKLKELATILNQLPLPES